MKIGRGQANRLIVVVGAFDTPGAQMIVRVASETERLACSQILVFGDKARLQREAVARAEELILSVDTDVRQVIGAASGDPIGYHVGRQAKGAKFPGVPSPCRFYGEPPCRCDSLKVTGPFRFCAQCGEGP